MFMYLISILFYIDPFAVTLIVYLNPGQQNAFLKSFFSLEIYGVIYKKGLTTNITTCPDYLRCNFNCERVYTQYVLFTNSCNKMI